MAAVPISITKNAALVSGFALEVIGKLDDFGEMPCTLRVFSAFAMDTEQEDSILARFIGVSRNGDGRV